MCFTWRGGYLFRSRRSRFFEARLRSMDATLDLPSAPEVVREEAAGAATGQGALDRWPKSWLMRAWYGLCYALEGLFGLMSLVACLAVLAAIPVVNFVSLGYLLEASGRVARSGRVRDGLIDIGKFARIGSMAAGTWICLLVPRLVSSLASDAWLIDPESGAARAW